MRRSPIAIAAALILLFAATFFLPYLVPVVPAVSLSYIVGYNNRTAFLLFAVGSVLFALLVRDCFPEADPSDQRLGLPSLFAGLAVALFSCIARIFPIAQHTFGIEAGYGLNRIQMLASGHRPYTDFEFIYGPSHLYIPVFLAHLTHSSVVRGYYLWWIIQWLTGTAMLWVAVRVVEMPLPHRRLLFWLLFSIQLTAVFNEGIAYTPTRYIGSAFFIVLVATLWSRNRSPFRTVSAAVLCVAAAFANSPEQGIAMSAGFLIWFVLLATSKLSPFPPAAAVVFAFAATIGALICWRLGEFATLIDFSAGAYAFPLLPSPTNVVILCAYVAAACIAVSQLLTKRFDSVIVPLFFAGFALLPAAMGRCDAGHLLSATPALLLGVAAVESRPSLRKWWSPLALLFVVIPILGIEVISGLENRRQVEAVSSRPPIPGVKPDPAIFARAHCPVIYRSLNVAPEPTDTSVQDCLDTGRFYATVDAFTPRSVQTLLDELNRSPARPLLLFDRPLADQFKPRDANLSVLYVLELSFWLPRPRNPPFTYQKVIDSIESNYTPNPTPIGGFRIWYPRSSP